MVGTAAEAIGHARVRWGRHGLGEREIMPVEDRAGRVRLVRILLSVGALARGCGSGQQPSTVRQCTSAHERAVRCKKVRSDSGRGGHPMGEHEGVSTGSGAGGIRGMACQRLALCAGLGEKRKWLLTGGPKRCRHGLTLAGWQVRPVKEKKI
jgi:hypothetical protein